MASMDNLAQRVLPVRESSGSGKRELCLECPGYVDPGYPNGKAWHRFVAKDGEPYEIPKPGSASGSKPEYAWLACGSLTFRGNDGPAAHRPYRGVRVICSPWQASGTSVLTVKAVAAGQKNLAVLLAYAALAMLAMGA